MIPHFQACDLLFVEGDSSTTSPKIEVWRKALGTSPISARNTDFLAMVTDEACDAAIPILLRCEVPKILDWLLKNVPDAI